jgi:hypothetical protein
MTKAKNSKIRPKSNLTHQKSEESSVAGYINYRWESANPIQNISNNKLRVVNISLDRIANELNMSNEAHNGISPRFYSLKALNIGQYDDNELLKQLSPQQRQEIMRIRQEGNSRCGQIINQVNNRYIIFID